MLIGLVIAHEWGHFTAAKRSGVEVEEFGLGFPPKAKTLGHKNGTEYTLNWLPLGGFVRLKGEHDDDTENGSFGAARLRDKVKIMMAGVAVNALIAVVLLSIVALFGLPQVLENQFYVASDSEISVQDVVVSVSGDGEDEALTPASIAGLQDGDVIRSFRPVDCVDSEQNQCTTVISDAQGIVDYTSTQAGQEVAVEFVDYEDGTVQTATATFTDADVVEQSVASFESCVDQADTDVADSGDEADYSACVRPVGYFGVIPDDYVERKATWSAPIVATVFSAQVVQETLVTFGTIISELFKAQTQTAQENLVGVVGIGYVLGEIADRGFIALLFLTGIISLSLALMNALPIPALDGGRLWVTLLFRLFNKPLSKETEERIHGTGFAALMLLFVLITVLDVQRFIL